MKIKNTELTTLANLLHNNSIDMRQVIYLAMAEIISSRIISQNELTKDYDKLINIQIKKIVNFINEIAIVDITMLEKSILNVLNYKLSKRKMLLNENTVYGIMSFEDVLGTSNYFSKEVIESINTNIALYKTTMLATLKAINSIMDVADGN